MPSEANFRRVRQTRLRHSELGIDCSRHRAASVSRAEGAQTEAKVLAGRLAKGPDRARVSPNSRAPLLIARNISCLP